jgi:hypothetical protein
LWGQSVQMTQRKTYENLVNHHGLGSLENIKNILRLPGSRFDKVDKS